MKKFPFFAKHIAFTNRLMPAGVAVVGIIIFFGILSDLDSQNSLPEPKQLSEMIQSSDYVAKVIIETVQQKKIKSNTISVLCVSKVQKAYKAKFPLPPQIELSFLVMPKLYGKYLVSVPPKGEYILFMNQKVFTDANGKPVESIVLYEPHPYAMQDYSTELESKILEITK